MKRSHHGSGASALIVNSSIPGWLHVGTRGHWWRRPLVTWTRRVGHDYVANCDESPAAVGELNSKRCNKCRQLRTRSRQAQSQRENALQAQLADLSDRLNLNMAEAELAVDPEPVTRRCRVFIESRAFSKFANFDSKAASWKDWACKFENMAAAVVPSSRDSLEWAAQQETPILTVYDVESGPGSR